MTKQIIIALLAFFPFTLPAQDGWVAQLFMGSATNAHTPLVIRQDGYADINFIARYSEQPFYEAPYYLWRIGKWKNNKAWELEMIHHKLILQNPPPEVQSFSVSHGYNLVTVNRAWQKGKVIYRLGAGAVLAHPESEVRNQLFENVTGGQFGNGQFYWSGITAQAAVERRFQLRGKWHWSLEAKATASYARVPIANGTADMPNTALHGVLGIGRSW